MDEAPVPHNNQPAEWESDQRLKLALKAAHMGIWAWDPIENEAYWDERTFQIYGLPPRSGVGATVDEILALVHPEDRGAFQSEYHRAVEQAWPEIVAEYRVVWPDGSIHHVATRGRAFYDQAGRLARTFGVVQDITPTRRLEEQVRQAQKLESIGRLAGGIGHEFNNLLTVINGYAQLLLRDLDSSHPLHGHAAQIQRAGEQAAGLTRQLLALGRKQLMNIQLLNANDVIRDLEPLLRRAMQENVELQLLLEPALGFVLADRTQISEVILTLALNARDAMPQGGLLTLQTENVQAAGSLDAGLDVLAGDYILLTVTDTGAGMDAETQKHLFEPFFTTKGQERGAGPGLATAYGIVTQSGGRIKFHSEPGRGTTFQVYLPRAHSSQSEPVPGPASPVLEEDSGTILVVEDQAQVRELACLILRSCGYLVLEAANSTEALHILETHPEPIHLVLTDVIMPGGGGSELAERAKRVRPGIAILFMSGYSDQVISHHGVLHPGVELLQKPFDSDSLLKKIRELLQARPSRGAVLIVDDEAGLRKLIREVLEAEGYRVLEAADGKQAIAAGIGRHINLLITDLAMPEMEGIEVIRAFSQAEPPPAIIAISGAFGESVLKAARLLGAKATLVKPVDIGQLVALVNQLLGE